MLRILEEQEKVLLKEEEDKSFQEKLTSPFTQNKNVDMKPRQNHGKIETGGMKFKVLGDNSSEFKFKIKNKK